MQMDPPYMDIPHTQTAAKKGIFSAIFAKF